MPLVTIVIPAYNVENYVGKSIESVLNQTATDWELIVINDGSTDNTLSIIQGYADKDSRIKVVDQANGGVSVARNKGLSLAQGEYLSFLDADDFYEPEYIALMSEPLINGDAQLSFCKYKEYLGEKVIAETPLEVTALYNNDFIEHLLHIDKVHNMSLMYDVKALAENELCFLTGCPNGEDRMFVVAASFYLKAAFVPHYLYSYIYRENSASRMYISYEKLFLMLDGYLQQEEYFLSKEQTPRTQLYLKYADKEILGVENNIRRQLWADLKNQKYDQVLDVLNSYKQRYGKPFEVRYKGLKKFTMLFKMKVIQSENKKLWQMLFK